MFAHRNLSFAHIGCNAATDLWATREQTRPGFSHMDDHAVHRWRLTAGAARPQGGCWSVAQSARPTLVMSVAPRASACTIASPIVSASTTVSARNTIRNQRVTPAATVAGSDGAVVERARRAGMLAAAFASRGFFASWVV